MTTKDTLLKSYRTAATTERDKGTYFERLCAAFLTADPVQPPSGHGFHHR